MCIRDSTGTLTGTIATAAQPNITSVGTLTGLTTQVSGIHLNTLLGNTSTRPALTTGSTATPYEIRGIGSVTPGTGANTAGDDGFLRLRAGGGTSTGNATYIDLSGYTNNVADMSKTIVFGTSGTERMRILSDGNVGIGTTTPESRFTVSIDSPSLIEAGRFTNYSTGTGAGIGQIISTAGTGDAYTRYYAGQNFTVGMDNSDNVFKLVNGTGLDGTLGISINASGNVGIGQVNQLSLIHI